MNKSLYYLSIVILFQFFSCKNKSDSLIDSLIIDESKLTSDTTKNTKDKEDDADNYFPSSALFIGQKLSINYLTYGCFNSSNDTITITREKDGYPVLHSIRSNSSDNYSTAKERFDSSYSLVLKSFSLNCKKIIKDKRRNTLNDKKNSSFGTIKKLTMNDGLHYLELFIENDNMFFNLLSLGSFLTNDSLR